MKITTRISFGYGLFIAALLGLAAHQAYTLHRMQKINRMVAAIDFQNTLACLQAMRDMDLVEEYTRKSFALGDPDYLELLREYRQDFENDLRELKNRAGAGDAQSEVARLARQWDAFNTHLAAQPPDRDTLPEILRQDFTDLGARIRSVYQANLRSMSDRVESARRTGETALLVLWFIMLAAVFTGILVSFLIYRSISKPLRHLTEGTRAIAEGKFFYRLDTTRRDEFSQLAKDFNAMTRRLDELDQLKKDFVSHVSHELKSPLASMQETIKLLLEQIPGPLNEKQRRLLELNQQSGARLTAMIGNLLDLSRTEAGVMEYALRTNDLIALTRTVVEEMEVQAAERRIHLETAFPETPLLVECDGDRIIQVLVNILTNALKFSPESSTVRIAVETVRDLPENLPVPLSAGGAEDCFARITVSDKGAGIPDQDKEKIFEKFHQAKQGKKIPGQGAGLGLAICRSIMLAHRGAIWAEDNPGGGSRFCVLLRKSRSAVGDQYLLIC